MSLVMLIVSMVATVLTQFLTSSFNTHGLCLRRGLRDLISHLDPALTESVANEIATAILRHPLIGGPRNALGGIVHRDELTALMIELASDNGWTKISQDSKTALKNALQKNGIADPKATLADIRAHSVVLEQEHPEWASSFRHDMAILHAAQSPMVAKINAWFDQTIDRVSSRFTIGVRWITFGCALFLAIGLQLDTVRLLNGLWSSDAIRSDLVGEATQIQKIDPTFTPDAIKLGKAEMSHLQEFSTYGLLVIPNPNPREWFAQFSPLKLPGVVLSAFLLSLGAPFWYNALKTLLRLKSVIADKDDAQRIARQVDNNAGIPGPPTTGLNVALHTDTVPKIG
jgi:hypothetical protein